MNGNTDIDINIEIYIQRHNDGPMNTFRISKKASRDIATD